MAVSDQSDAQKPPLFVEVRVPIREYLDQRFAQLATKEDVAAIRLDVAVMKQGVGDLKGDVSALKSQGPKAVTWSGIGSAVGAALIVLLGYLGVKPPGQQ